MPEPQLASLVTSIGQRDDSAQESLRLLYQLTAPELGAIVTSWLPIDNPLSIDDILVATYEQAWRHAARSPVGVEPLRWLTALALTALRAARRSAPATDA